SQILGARETKGRSVTSFVLPEIRSGDVSLGALLADGPVLLVFVHGDCPTSALALRHLAPATAAGVRPVAIAEEDAERAARLARRTGVRFPVLAQGAPYDVSRAYGVEAVPTAVLVDGSDAHERVVGWDRAAYERLLGLSLPDVGPAFKPGCGSRLVEPAPAGGLDELEDMFERGWTDGLPVVPPTPE